MSRIKLDRALASAAGRDAGNRSMRAAGRKHWNEDDYNAAARECNRLFDIIEAEEFRRFERSLLAEVTQ